MMKDMDPSPTSPEKVCARLRKIGYSQSRSVKLYGEIFELISDPYLDGDQFVVEAHAQNSSANRVVRIPKFIVRSADAA